MNGTMAICPGNSAAVGVNASPFQLCGLPGQTGTDKTPIGMQSGREPGQTGTHSYRSVPLSRPDADSYQACQRLAMMIVQATTAKIPAARAYGLIISRPAARVSLVEVAMQIRSRAPMTINIANPFVSILSKSSSLKRTIKRISLYSQSLRVLPSIGTLRVRRAPTLQRGKQISRGFPCQ